MLEVDWTQIERVTPRLPEGEQWVEIIAYRCYLNPKGTPCLALTLENMDGAQLNYVMSTFPRHYFWRFLQSFLFMDVGEFLRIGGYAGLVGCRMQIAVEYLPGGYPKIYPVYDE